MTIRIGDQITGAAPDTSETLTIIYLNRDTVTVVIGGRYEKLWKSQIVADKQIPAQASIQYFRYNSDLIITKKTLWVVTAQTAGSCTSMKVWSSNREQARRQGLGVLAKKWNKPVTHIIKMLGAENLTVEESK